MKANYHLTKLILLSLFAFLHLPALSQGHLHLNGNEICLEGTFNNDNCAPTENRISVLSYDPGEGFSLMGLEADFTEELRLGMEVDYLEVVDSEVEEFVLNGHFLEVHFFNAGTYYVDMQETGQLGFYFNGGRTAMIKGCGTGLDITNYLTEENICESMAVFLTERDKIAVETGIGTVLVIDELQDTTQLPPMERVAQGSILCYEDPNMVYPLEPITYQEGAELKYPEHFQYGEMHAAQCKTDHRAMTTLSCHFRASMLSRFYVCNNYLVVWDPTKSFNQSFMFNRIVSVYIYKDHDTNEYVIWRFGRCVTY